MPIKTSVKSHLKTDIKRHFKNLWWIYLIDIYFMTMINLSHYGKEICYEKEEQGGLEILTLILTVKGFE